MDGATDMSDQDPSHGVEDQDQRADAEHEGVPTPPVPDEAWGRGFDIDKGKKGTGSMVANHNAEASNRDGTRAPMKVITSPQKPSRAEVEKHNLCHIPYEPWCSCCVGGRAKENPHKSSPDTVTRELPVVSMDWGYLAQKDDDQSLPMLVIRDSESKSIFAHGTPGMAIVSGDYGAHTVKRVVEDVDSLGYKRVMMKSDQEKSIKALQRRVKEAWTGEIVMMNSPVASSQSNGSAEKAVLDMEAMVRTLKIAVDARAGECLPTELPIILWLIEHAADVITRFRLGRDGKTARERIIGKQDIPPMAEFGEMVLYLPLDRDRGQVAELSPKLLPGVWLGLERSTNEAKIGTASGVIQARTVRRRPEAERWSSDAIRKVIGVPWDPTPGVVSSEMKTAALVPGEEGGITDMALEKAPAARHLKLSKSS